jgi:hypothetical protein
MDSAIALALLVLLPAILLLGLFVWAALKDGQEDKALQERLGIRRRARARALAGTVFDEQH